MFCPNCGSQNADTNRFCQRCGSALPVITPSAQPPTPTPPPFVATSRSRNGAWLILLVILAIAVVGVTAYVVTKQNGTFDTSSVPEPIVAVPQSSATATAQSALPGSTALDTSLPAVTPRPTDEPLPAVTASATPQLEMTPTIAVLAVAENVALGSSAGGRSIPMLVVGQSTGPAVVVVGSIEGDQADTSEAVNQLLNYYQPRPDHVPNGGVLYLIPSLNPDGNASDSRFNQNGVDLNRNWETANWVSNATVPGGQRGAGGSFPFSEPETQALRDLLNSLRASGRPVYLVVLHSTVNNNLRDQVFPGYTSAAIHPASEDLARRIGNLLGYRYNTEWTYDTTGEVIAWCAEQDMPAVDIVSKKGSGPSQSQMIRVLEEMLR